MKATCDASTVTCSLLLLPLLPSQTPFPLSPAGRLEKITFILGQTSEIGAKKIKWQKELLQVKSSAKKECGALGRAALLLVATLRTATHVPLVPEHQFPEEGAKPLQQP